MASELRIEKNIFAAAGVLSGGTQGLTETAILIANQAKDLAPVAKVAGGRLKNSIMYQVESDIEGGFNNSGGEKAQGTDRLSTNPKTGEAYIGTNLDYAVYQEYGTRHQKGRAFMRPAVQIVLNPGNGLAIAKAWERAMARAFAQKRTVTKIEVKA